MKTHSLLRVCLLVAILVVIGCVSEVWAFTIDQNVARDLNLSQRGLSRVWLDGTSRPQVVHAFKQHYGRCSRC